MAVSSHFWAKKQLKAHKNNNAKLNTPFNENQYYKRQLDILANAMFIDDYFSNMKVIAYPILNNGNPTPNLRWLDKGEPVSGSFITNTTSKILNLKEEIEYNDIDIYFRSKEDVIEFTKLNNIDLPEDQRQNQMCFYVTGNNHRYNLIYGVNFLTVEDLISKFDVRACSVAFCPNKNEFYALDGTVEDTYAKKIVFNPLPRTTTISRLIKYVNKGFYISAHQRAFMAQPIRTNNYLIDLELNTDCDRY